MSFQQAVPYGDNVRALEQSLPEIPTTGVVAIVSPGLDILVLEKVRSFLTERRISFEVVEASSDSPDAIFSALDALKARAGRDALLVNVSVGTPLHSHLLLCAAMATGVAAFGVYDGKVVFLPISCSISHGR